MDDDERFEKLRENEIKRLTDSLGKEEPVKGILTDDEVLKYAGDSVSASEIRLKRGIGTKSDKGLVNDTGLTLLGAGGFLALVNLAVFGFISDYFIGKILFFLTIAIIIGYYSYVMYIKDYTDPQYKIANSKNVINSSKIIEETKISDNDDLLLLFESKEKIAREMIERKFPAPQLTNTKFNSVLDNCKEVVESQIRILNSITPTDKTKYEIASRKKLIKQVISKVDDLTNELILSEESNLEDVIEEMDNLINSVQEY